MPVASEYGPGPLAGPLAGGPGPAGRSRAGQAPERGLREWLAGAEPGVRDASAANRDEMRTRGSLILGSLVLSAGTWTITGALKFGATPATMCLAGAGAFGLAGFLAVVDRGNAAHALRLAGGDLLGAGKPPFPERVRRAAAAGGRLAFPVLDAALVMATLLPVVFGDDVAAFRERSFREANAAVHASAVAKVDAAEAALAAERARADAAAALVAAEGDAVRALPWERTGAVDAGIVQRIDALAAARAEAERRAARHELERMGEVDGVRLGDGRPTGRGRGAQAIAAELRRDEQRGLAARLDAEIARLEGQAPSLREAEARRVEEARRIRAERLARNEADALAARARQAAAVQALRDAAEARPRLVAELVESDPAYAPRQRPGIANDFAALVALALHDPARGFMCATALLMLLSILLIGPLAAMAVPRNAYAARLADSDAAEIERIAEAARVRSLKLSYHEAVVEAAGSVLSRETAGGHHR